MPWYEKVLIGIGFTCVVLSFLGMLAFAGIGIYKFSIGALPL
jgi:hypothetical protein